MSTKASWHATLAALALQFAILCAVPTRAQEATATFTGTVKDPSGAVVPATVVTLRNQKTNVTRTKKSSADGSYVFTLVPIGTYELSAEHAGFRKYVQTGIVLNINQNARQDITLEVGATTQVVEISSQVAQVDTAGATLGKVETERRILDLPLVGRDTLQLGLLQAGVFAPDPDDGSGNPFSVSGQRSESLTFLIDGADNTDFLGNNIIISPNPDAVQEFKILTNNYEAEYGRTSGGIVNQVIKSGTNSFHGDAFEFLRNADLNARDFFLPDTTAFNRNVFGGTTGGPIKKNKAFFFVSYQGQRRREGVIAPVLTVLSPNERTGNFSELLTGQTSSPCPNPMAGDPAFDTGQLFNPTTTHSFTCGDGTQIMLSNPYPNNQVPVNPISANYISKYLPLPNLPGNQFVSGPSNAISDDQSVARVDYNLSVRDVISGVYLYESEPQFYPFQIINGASTGGNVPVGSAFDTTYHLQTGSLSWTHTVSPTIVNEFRFAANRSASLQAVPLDRTTPQQLGFTNVNPDDPAGAAPPVITTPTFNLGPNPEGPTTINDATFQWQDTVSVVKGKHSFKFGGDVRRVRNNFNFDFFTNGSFDFDTIQPPTGGSFTGSPLADFVAGFPDNYYQSSQATYDIRTTSWFFFAQDSWKLTRRLTLDLGLRYEYNTPQYDTHNEILGYFPGQQSTVFPQAPPGILYPNDPGTPNRALVYPDRNNFGPRFGFAWDVRGTGKFVVRGGFGVFYDIEDGALNLQFGGQPPFGDITSTPTPSTPLTPGLNYFADPFTPFGYTNPYPFQTSGQFFVPKISTAYVTDPRFRTPYSENFNFGFQSQLTPNTMLEAVLVGSLGRKLISSTDLNFRNPNEIMQRQQEFGIPSPPAANDSNIDCARPLSGCFGTSDPNASPTQVAGQLYTNLSNGLSDSYQLQVTLDKRLSHGFEMRGAYTLAKTIDLTSGFRARSSTYTNPLDYGQDRGLADFDAPQRLVISGIWQLPLDRHLQGNRFLRKLTQGWQGNGIVTFQSGNPINLYSENNSSQQSNGLDRPDVIGPVQIFHDPRANRTFTPSADGIHGSCLPGATTGNFWFDPTNLVCAVQSPGFAGGVPVFSFGTLGRNTFLGPGINNWDLSLTKTTKITESQSIEFRAEFFNAWNHAQFQFVASNGYGGSGVFGQITSTRPHDSDTTSDARIIQFGLKYYF
jgi:hypothetical protein